MFTNNPIHLRQITDTHCYADDHAQLIWSKIPVAPNQNLLRALAHLQQLPTCDALVITGDLVQEETAAAYQRVQSILANYPEPIYVLAGNHDQSDLLQAHLLNTHIHWQKHQQFGKWHCIFLNTNRPHHGEGYLSTDDLEHLQATLSQLNSTEHALIFLHHHPIVIGSGWMERTGLQQPQQLWDVLYEFPQVKGVVFGHIHSEFQSEVQSPQGNKIVVYGTPATCVQLTHDNTCLGFKHANPAWRELLLYADGLIETQVHYLSD